MKKQNIDKLINDITITEGINYKPTLILTKEEKEFIEKYGVLNINNIRIIKQERKYVE